MEAPVLNSLDPCDLLFVPYDAGEAHAFEAVIPRLRKEGYTCRVLKLGTARKCFESWPETFCLHGDLKLPVDVNARTWTREMAVDTEVLAAILKCLPARVVFVGTVSKVQLQIADAFRQQKIPAIAYCDVLHRVAEESWPSRFLGHADEIWVTSEAVASSFLNQGPHAQLRVVGLPSIEYWQTPISSGLDLSRLPYWGRRVPVLFISGYGNDFVPSFQLFLEACQDLPGCQFYVSAHPKLSGEQELRQLAGYAGDNVSLLPPGFRTRSMAEVCQVVVAYRSLAGIQSLFLGRPVIYVMVGKEHFSNLAIETGLAPRALDKEDLVGLIREALHKEDGALDPGEVSRRLGLPPRNIHAFVEAVENLFSSSPK